LYAISGEAIVPSIAGRCVSARRPLSAFWLCGQPDAARAVPIRDFRKSVSLWQSRLLWAFPCWASTARAPSPAGLGGRRSPSRSSKASAGKTSRTSWSQIWVRLGGSQSSANYARRASASNHSDMSSDQNSWTCRTLRTGAANV